MNSVTTPERTSRSLAIASAMVALILVLLPHAVSAIPSQATPDSVPLFANLGTHHYAITTSVPLAQRYFDQGLKLYYAFNHGEAARAFEEASRVDPDCAMCYWGLALAYGPNINAPMEHEAALAAYDAIQKAIAREATAGAKERALICALATRYAADPPKDRATLDAAYAQALRDVAQRYPADFEVATLYAEALMDLSPRNYWTAEGQPRAETPEILKQLERVLAANPNHPGANHLYIHAVEAAQPERAVAAAERLAAVMPGAGHIVHMPGHIYIRVGRYLDAITANEHAVHADEVYIEDQRPKNGIYTLGYYPHNYDFLAFAASMIGRSGQAMTAAEKMRALVPPDLLRAPGMTFLQLHDTRHLQMLVRFARWQEIVEAPAPGEDLVYGRTIWQYTRGRALAAIGKIKEAEEALHQVHATAENPDVASLRLEVNTSGAILQIASEVLAGHVAEAEGDVMAAITHLREGARLEDALTYGEPPEWSVPVRQELGMMLLRVDRATEAEQAFRQDLKRFPDNGWSLRGQELALRRQGRKDEADGVKAKFNTVWSSADIDVPIQKKRSSRKKSQVKFHQQIAAVDMELRRFMAAISAGGDIPALVDAVKECNDRRTVSERLAELVRSQQLNQTDYDELELELRNHFRKTWLTIMSRQITVTRQILGKLFNGNRLPFNPVSDENGSQYEFNGTASIGPLLTGVQRKWCPQRDVNSLLCQWTRGSVFGLRKLLVQPFDRKTAKKCERLLRGRANQENPPALPVNL